MKNLDMIKSFTRALNLCGDSGNVEQLCLSTNKGKLMVLIVKIDDKNFMPEVCNADPMPQMQSPDIESR